MSLLYSNLFDLQFTNLLKQVKGVHTAYLDNYVTVFAPSNDAMNKYKGPKDENFLLHHMGKCYTLELPQYKMRENILVSEFPHKNLHSGILKEPSLRLTISFHSMQTYQVLLSKFQKKGNCCYLKFIFLKHITEYVSQF